MKRIVLVLSFIFSFIWADTSVYLENKTPHTLALTYGYEGGTIDKGGYTTGPASITPNQKIEVMRFSRGANLEPKKTYTFTTNMQFPDGSVVKLIQRVNVTYIALGPLKKSTITAAALGSNFSTPFSDESLTQQFASSTDIGGQTYAISFQWSRLPNTSGYHDITYTIAATGQVTKDNELTLWQHNIQQRPSTEGASHQLTRKHSTRSSLSTITLPDAIKAFDPNVDVITINEAFTQSLRPELVQQMKKNGFIYNTQVLNAGTSRAWSGGVMVFSKYPIVATRDYQYQAAASADTNAAKGVQYVKIVKGQKPYHIFATHTNASYTFGEHNRLPMDDPGRIARRNQFQELRQFIDRQNIPNNEPVIIVGDMNVDMSSERGQSGDEYTDMVNKLNAVHAIPIGHSYTLDKNTNEWVDPSDGPPQHLDYVLYSRTHERPKGVTGEVICLKSNGKNICRKGAAQNLSDHYPVRARFIF